MKIKFCNDNGANIHSKKEDIFSPEDLGFSEEDWKTMPEDDRIKMVEEWALERFDYWYEEIP